MNLPGTGFLKLPSVDRVTAGRRSFPNHFFALIVLVALALAPSDAEARKDASIVIDADTGLVLHAKNADELVHPASLTKMMTLYMVFEALDKGWITPGQKLEVSSEAQQQQPSRLGLKKGETITVEDAIYALITKSANDAAVVLAEALGGTEQAFAAMMTRVARELGMSRTTFRNASGLYNGGQLSTARDMAVLGMALMHHFPQYYALFRTGSFEYRGRTYRNHNRLLDRYDGTEGIKTGYIRAAGFNLVASVRRNGHRLIGVVIGGRTQSARDKDMVEILDRAFMRIAMDPINVPTPVRKPMQDAPPVAPSTAQAAAFLSEGDISVEDSQMLAQGSRAADPTVRAWGVQAGAFANRNQADRTLRQAYLILNPALGEMTQAIKTHRGGEQEDPVYRARLAGFSEAQARRACTILKARDLACHVVPPERLDFATLSR